jgi:hypothetical protein
MANRKAVGGAIWVLLVGVVAGAFWYASYAREQSKQEETRRQVNESLKDAQDAACRAKRALGERCD